MSILQLNEVSYQYEQGKAPVLAHVNYVFEAGQMYAIVGASGAGKTTLLSLLSSLAKPTKGTICFNGTDMNEIDKYQFRSSCIGVVFQNFNLLTHLTALENVMLSMDISGKSFADKKNIAVALLRKVGLSEAEMNRRVLKLSGGQQQRVAIARALSYDPQVILADEPTGNLDAKTRDDIMDIFHILAEEGKCVILVTHSKTVAGRANQVYELGGNISDMTS